MPLLLHDLDKISYDSAIDSCGESVADDAMETTTAPNIELMSALSTYALRLAIGEAHDQSNALADY